MTQFLRGLAAGRVVLCLEGGYNVTSISYAMTMCTKALLGDPIPHPVDPKAPCHWSAVESITDVIKTHQKYWKSLKFYVALPSEEVLEPPLPSRGLMDSEDKTETTLSSLEDSSKTLHSLEENLANLSLKKCSDGIHCGTDDEEDSTNNRSKSPEYKCENSKDKEVDEVQGSSNPAEASSEQGPSKGEKKTLVDFLAENMHSIVDGEMFAVIPLPWCPHLETLYAIPSEVSFEQGVKCVDCDHTAENWVCLHCYIVSIILVT